MPQDGSRGLPICSNKSQDRSKTCPTGPRAPQGGHKEANTRQKPEKHHCVFAFDGLPKPQDGSKTAQELSLIHI
eukprot:6672747-Pyramimonas_sp.AAC.1